jgi:gamma-glutamyl-gamma-aminobutyrate hydrolase PuuD
MAISSASRLLIQPAIFHGEAAAGGGSIREEALPPKILILFSKAAENLSVRTACESQGACILQLNYEVEEIDPKVLEVEIDSIIARSHKAEPLPQQILGAECASVQKIKAIAQVAFEVCDGVLLPGGASILPKFYGQVFAEDEERHGYSMDSRRIVFELALTEACFKKHKPLLGICRGHQLIHIYKGGCLDRCSVKEFQQHRIRSIKACVEASVGMLGALPRNVYFYHQQTVVRSGEGFRSLAKIEALKDMEAERRRLDQERQLMRELIDPEDALGQLAGLEASCAFRERHIEPSLRFLELEGIVMASESLEAPVMSVQYHPEYMKPGHAGEGQVEANLVVFARLVEMAKTHRLARTGF